MVETTKVIHLQRVLRAPAERIFRAFVDADALCRWLPPYGFLGKIDRIDARVGGSYHMIFTNFEHGHSHAFESKFEELVPYERIRMAERFDDPAWAADMTKTISLRTVSCGTELEILHDGLPAFIPVDMCYLGWQESLLQLAQLVEHSLPDGQ